MALPTPGHTAGHAVLIADERHCFTGDHLWFSRRMQRLNASRSVCWHSWPDQCRSMERLAERRFEWVLPGHGERMRLPFERMRAEVIALAGRMRGESDGDEW
jgi:glyoxylase-like metal-dependent hydrolase (beta-lactamase superfamily II)